MLSGCSFSLLAFRCCLAERSKTASPVRANVWLAILCLVLHANFEFIFRFTHDVSHCFQWLWVLSRPLCVHELWTSAFHSNLLRTRNANAQKAYLQTPAHRDNDRQMPIENQIELPALAHSTRSHPWKCVCVCVCVANVCVLRPNVMPNSVDSLSWLESCDNIRF